MARRGKIIPNGVVLEPHEYITAVFLTDLGYNVECIEKSNVEGIHSPDIKMNGLKWEMKSPTGEGRYLMANTIQKAVKQSKNIIIDLRRVKRHEIKCLNELKKEFEKSKSIRKLWIITKRKKLIEYSK